MSNHFNSKDQKQWNQIFESPNPAWKDVPEQPFMSDALNFFKLHQVKSILDIGCGVGVWSMLLAKNGFDVYGTDFSENAVKVCREWTAEKSLKAHFEVAPITADAFPNKIFDGALATMILDNVVKEEMEEAITLLKEKLKPAGVLFALFNPFLSEEQKAEILKASNNPTKNITSVTYSDNEILQAFPGFRVISFKKYPLQGLEFRGIMLQKI